MVRHIRALIYIAVVCLFFFFLPDKIYASSNFTTDYHVTYSISQTGVTHAILNVTLTNTSSQYYASSYKMQLGFDNITNITASDTVGQIDPVISKTDDGYLVGLTFNKKAVGLGTKLTFTLSFDTTSVAKNFGKIWEINIPGIANPEDFTSFTVTIQAPKSFGTPAYIKPEQPTDTLTFNKDQLGRSGISIAFGNAQLYSFHLAYHLKNTNLYPVTTEIALPPSTNYQDVYINEMKPAPTNVLVDADGNWLAQYRLYPSQKLEVSVQGVSQIHLQPSEQTLTQSQLTAYTAERPYWQANNDQIREIADELKTPEAIYDFVVKTLKYDFGRVIDDKPRLGAVDALKDQSSAVCLEFTDLFIAIARAAHIPAREVDGFAFTENTKQRPLSLVKDILHAWPEYYDARKKTWIMVDPTWGNTTGGTDYFNTIDFDHFAFVIKGLDSLYPVPAGGYKLDSNLNTKDVSVGFADIVPDPTAHMVVSADNTSAHIAGIPIAESITIANSGQSAIPSQIIYISSHFLTPHDQTYMLTEIPPYATSRITVGFSQMPFLTNRDAAFTIRISGQENSLVLKIAPLFFTPWGIGGMSFGIFTIVIFIAANKIWRLRFSR